MERTQIASFTNTITGEILGESAVVTEDLSNIVDVGTALFNANAVDRYVKALVNQIGKIIFDDRVYKGSTPSIMRDAWEWGSVAEKIRVDMPEATENESWELINGESYDPNIFYQPTVEAKFYNKRVTFEIPMSFTERQVKESFQNATQYSSFISMLFNAVEKAITVRLDALITRAIANLIGDTVYDDIPSGTYTGAGGVKCVNLLYDYNQIADTPLDVEEALTNPDFIRYACYVIGQYTDRLAKISTLFNIGGKEKFTPAEYLHVITLSAFDKAATVYLQSDTYHKDLVSLPAGREVVPYWQGSGTDYAFEDVSNVNVTTSNSHSVDIDGVIAVMFDREAIGVACLDRRTTSAYNAKAEFYTNFNKVDAGYWNDENENFVVFYIAEANA